MNGFVTMDFHYFLDSKSHLGIDNITFHVMNEINIL